MTTCEVFFGLEPEDQVNIIWEQQFLLSYYLGVSMQETYEMKTCKRLWLIERLKKEISQSGASKGAHDNTPENRALQGFHRDVVPSKLRRFT